MRTLELHDWDLEPAEARRVQERLRERRVDRPPAGVRPVYASVGHRVDLDTAVEVVLASAPTYRVPEPIRRADRLVGGMRRGEEEG